MNYEQMYGYFRTRKFTDIFPDYNSFLETKNEIQLDLPINDNSLKNLYYLLYARYGNSHIASFDENQFIYKLFSIIFTHGGAWEEKYKIQKDIKALTTEQLKEGNSTINNTAYNPDTQPAASYLEGLPYISQQTAANQKRGELEKLVAKYNQIATDVTEDFLLKFKKLFLTVVFPEEPGWYITEEDNQ